MTKLVFGQTPPEDAVIVVRPRRPTPCAMPHFDRDGEPRSVPGQLYRQGGEAVVLCKHHGQQRFGL